MDFNDVGPLRGRVEEIRLDTGTGEAARRVIADIACEFPVVPAHLLGAHTHLLAHHGPTVYFGQVCSCREHIFIF